MLITKEWLEEEDPCEELMEWFLNEGIFEPIPALENLIAKDKLDWAIWMVTRLLNKEQIVKYSMYADEQSLNIFEKKIPMEAIEHTKNYLKNKNEANRSKVYMAFFEMGFSTSDYMAYSSYAATYVVYASASAVDFDTYEDYLEASSSTYAAAAAAYSKASNDLSGKLSAHSSADNMKKNILNFGIELLKKL